MATDYELQLVDRCAKDTLAVVRELLALRKDAKRYRWLRDSGATISRTTRPGEERESVEVDAGAWARRATLDDAVDAAMAGAANSGAA